MSTTATPRDRGDYRLPLHRRRKLVNAIALVLSMAAMARSCRSCFSLSARDLGVCPAGSPSWISSITG